MKECVNLEVWLTLKVMSKGPYTFEKLLMCWIFASAKCTTRTLRVRTFPNGPQWRLSRPGFAAHCGRCLAGSPCCYFALWSRLHLPSLYLQGRGLSEGSFFFLMLWWYYLFILASESVLISWLYKWTVLDFFGHKYFLMKIRLDENEQNLWLNLSSGYI